jgi:hypothetical protein
MKMEKTQISKIRDYFENNYYNQLENAEEMVLDALDTYEHPKLNQENVNHVNRSVTHNEIEAAIKSLLPKKSLGWILS